MITDGDLMKRALDEIELEEIESFHIDCNTLIVRTKTEENVYQYPNQLELLRRISYFIHRYEVEHNRKEDEKKEKANVSVTPVQKECQKRLHRSRNIVYGVYIGYMLLTIMFQNISPVLFNVMFAIDGVVLVSSMRDAAIIKHETLKQKEEKRNYDEQLDKGFESLKEASISYLNKISKTLVTTSNTEERHFIEQIEQGFQKRIGTYPQQ